MKNWALLLLMLSSVTFAFSQNTLTVSDPQSWGGEAQGTIEEAILEIRPAGAYLEMSLEFTLSSSGTYYNSVRDTVEAVLNFDLPVGAIIHDSWLWVGPDIIQGLLIERTLATNIYEGIVNRRKDPSILYKNSDTKYELRVFPMAGNETRRVKIKYLLPASYSTTEMSVKLPVGLFKSSKTIPDLLVLAHSNATFQSPVLYGGNSVPALNGPDSLNRFATLVPAAALSASADIRLSYQSPLQDGIFTAYYPMTQQSGYYQIVVDPSLVSMGATQPKKLVFVLHHEPNLNDLSFAELIYWSKVFMKQQLSPTDSFNVVFTKNSNALYKNMWVPATAANIDSAFNAVATQSVYVQSATFGQKMTLANDFIQANGGAGRMLLVTNHNNRYNSQQVTNYLQSVNSVFPVKAPMDIVNYYDAGSGQDANTKNLFSQLASLFNGSYFGMDIKLVYTNNWYNYEYQCTETIMDLFGYYSANTAAAQTQYYDIYPTLTTGLTYARYSLDDYNITGQAKVQLGKYQGIGPIDVTFNALTDTGFVTKIWPAVQPYDTDTFSRKIWGGAYIAALEGNSVNSNLYRTIVDSSKAYRVLSYNTAFLCLEPSDTISVCKGCSSFEDENGPVLLGLDEVDMQNGGELSLSANPNPFNNMVIFNIEVPEQLQGTTITITITDLLGRVVATELISTISGKPNYHYTWSGNSSDGKAMPAGIYVVSAVVGSKTQTLKVVKAN